MDKNSRLILLGLLFFGGLSVFLSCEKDDICANEELTPFLIITFVEEDDTDELKDVIGLQIKYIGDGSEDDPDQLVYDSEVTTDSITLLLPTNKNKATFIFMENYNDVLQFDDSIVFDEDADDEDFVDYSIVGGELVEFFYDTEEEYINRACGFRTTYSNLRIERTPIESDTITGGFITSRPDFNETIEDEDEAHILFAHN